MTHRSADPGATLRHGTVKTPLAGVVLHSLMRFGMEVGQSPVGCLLSTVPAGSLQRQHKATKGGLFPSTQNLCHCLCNLVRYCVLSSTVSETEEHSRKDLRCRKRAP